MEQLLLFLLKGIKNIQLMLFELEKLVWMEKILRYHWNLLYELLLKVKKLVKLCTKINRCRGKR